MILVITREKELYNEKAHNEKNVYKKSLEINEEALKDIEDMYKLMDCSPRFSMTTEEDVHYLFENIKELLEYRFNEKIKKFSVCRDRYSEKGDLKFDFEVDYGGILVVYSEIATCSYSTSDENLDIVLKEKIEKFYKNHGNFNWTIGKIGLWGFTILGICIISFIGLLIMALNKMEFSKVDGIELFVFRWSILFIIMSIIKKIDLLMCKIVFKPIVYYLGEQKKTWDRIKSIRSNVFWGIIVATIVGILSSVIHNKLF